MPTFYFIDFMQFVFFPVTEQVYYTKPEVTLEHSAASPFGTGGG
jgi:hypothetical protein